MLLRQGPSGKQVQERPWQHEWSWKVKVEKKGSRRQKRRNRRRRQREWGLWAVFIWTRLPHTRQAREGQGQVWWSQELSQMHQELEEMDPAQALMIGRQVLQAKVASAAAAGAAILKVLRGGGGSTGWKWTWNPPVPWQIEIMEPHPR